MHRPRLAATLRRAFWPLLVFEATTDLATFILLDPLLALLLERIVSLSGDPFIGNTALASFVLSPIGMTALATAAIGVILVNILALGGVSLLLWDARQLVPVRPFAVWRSLFWGLPALLTISACTFAGVLILAVPLAVTAFAARRWLLSSGDLYFYIRTHPPEFMWTFAMISVVGLACAFAGFYLLQRAGLTLPICLLQPVSTRRALRLALQATRRRSLALLSRLVVVATGLALLWALALAVLSRLLGWFFAQASAHATLYWASMAFGLIAAVTFAALTTLSRASLVLVLITDRAADAVLPRLATPARIQTSGDSDSAHRALGARLRVTAALLLCFAIPTAALVETVRAGYAISLNRVIAVTAHRAGSARAPENTLAALRTAIAEGADVVEIDVQETADGQVVLLHDTDLRRVAGVARSIWEMQLDELQALDVGSWFSPAFHAERVPTLRQFAAAARGRVRLNVELKNNQRGEDLAARAVAVLRETRTADQAAISSLDSGMLREVRQIAPEIKLGLIVAVGIGNLQRIDVDFVALSRRWATPAVIRQLHATGREVQVWTLDDEASIARAMLDGADNIITSDTLMAVRVRAWFQGLSEPERTLLRIGHYARARWTHLTTNQSGPNDL